MYYMHTVENLKSNRAMKEIINTWNPNIQESNIKVLIGFSSCSLFFYVHAYVWTIINSLPLTHSLTHSRLGIYSRLCPVSLSCFIQFDSMIYNEHKAIRIFSNLPLLSINYTPCLLFLQLKIKPSQAAFDCAPSSIHYRCSKSPLDQVISPDTKSNHKTIGIQKWKRTLAQASLFCIYKNIKHTEK